MPSLIHPCDPATINQGHGNEFSGWLYSPAGVMTYYERVYAQRFRLAHGHPGTDYAVWDGTPVKAAAAGTVVHAGPGHLWHSTVGGGSITVVIDHGGFYTAYLHLQEVHVTEGRRVDQGTVIALSGRTGAGTGPHLHFQYMPKPVNFDDGYWGTRDPSRYFTATAAAGGTIAPIKEEDMPLSNDDVEKVAAAVWRYAHEDKKVSLGKDAYWWLRNPGYNVWRTQLQSVNGKLYQAAAFLINNNTNGWKIPGLERLLKKLAERAGVSKADLDAAVDEINANTDEAMAGAVVAVDVTVNGKAL